MQDFIPRKMSAMDIIKTKLRGTKCKEEGCVMDLITKASFTRGLKAHGP
jgi:hypothetical protein